MLDRAPLSTIRAGDVPLAAILVVIVARPKPALK
jgi:hypothetical protein